MRSMSVVAGQKECGRSKVDRIEIAGEEVGEDRGLGREWRGEDDVVEEKGRNKMMATTDEGEWVYTPLQGLSSADRSEWL